MSVKKRDVRRKGPDLAADRDELNLAEIEDGRPVEYSRVESGDFSERTIQQLVVRHSVIEGVSFAQAHLRSVQLRDVRFFRCDLSNAVVRGLGASLDFHATPAVQSRL